MTPRRVPEAPRAPWRWPLLPQRWRRRLQWLATAGFFVFYLPAAFFAGRVWMASHFPDLMRQHWSVTVHFTSVVWLGWLSLTTFLLWYQLYAARDLETLLTLPLGESQLFWRKLRSHSLALDGMTVVLLSGGTWAFCRGSGIGWALSLELALLFWVHLLAIDTVAAWLALWPLGRLAAGALLAGAVGGFFVLLQAAAEEPVAAAPAVDWQALVADLAGGPWTLALPPRWAVEALASEDRVIAAGAAAGATLGLAILALALARLGLPRAYAWEKLVAAREADTASADAPAARRPSWLARRVAGALSPRAHALLRATTQSPAPERRLDLLLPYTLAWTAAGAAIRLSAELLWPRFPPGAPLATPVFLASFCIPVLAAFLASAALAARGVPAVLPRGDQSQPPLRSLPVSFAERLRTALASNLAHLAGLTLITLPFFLLIPFPFPAYLAGLAAALGFAVLSALWQAAGPVPFSRHIVPLK